MGTHRIYQHMITLNEAQEDMLVNALGEQCESKIYLKGNTFKALMRHGLAALQPTPVANVHIRTLTDEGRALAEKIKARRANFAPIELSTLQTLHWLINQWLSEGPTPGRYALRTLVENYAKLHEISDGRLADEVEDVIAQRAE